MVTSVEYRNFIMSQMYLLGNVKYKQMMGEYLLYYDKILFGGIYDNRLLIKKTNSNKKYNFKEESPYKGAKPMYLVNDIDSLEFIKDIVLNTIRDLK